MFKIWDEKNKKTYKTGEQGLLSKNNLYKTILFFEETGVWSLWRFNASGDNYSKNLLEKPKEFLCSSLTGKLMQSTGLQDKNRKLIYEGDIVNWSQAKGGFLPPKNTQPYRCKIEWIKNEFQCNDCFKDTGYTFNPSFMEIIGNIYENPELLKSK